ncbi:MAG: dihydrodipicolinate synthase family protein [Lentisphaeria bacterium]|nr:dihydrodipicolinate synthase family protein [Lentisphaeria bacterium]
MSKIKFSGIYSALPTPLAEDGTVNAEVAIRLMRDQLAQGVKGFYVAGGTGEGVLLHKEQRMAIAETAVEACRGRGQVIVHTGAINVEDALELTRHATAIGADAISSILPSIYFSCSTGEIVSYYKELSAATHLPLLIYANLNGAGGNILEIMTRLLAETGNAIGVKDTRANYYEMWLLKQLNGGDINIINGPDESLLCGLSIGADAGIGTTYNIMPRWFVELFNRFRAGDMKGALELQSSINRVIKVLCDWSSECSIISSVKEVLRLQGYDMPVMARPLRRFPPEKSAAFKAALEKAGYPFFAKD